MTITTTTVTIIACTHLRGHILEQLGARRKNVTGRLRAYRLKHRLRQLRQRQGAHRPRRRPIPTPAASTFRLHRSPYPLRARTPPFSLYIAVTAAGSRLLRPLWPPSTSLRQASDDVDHPRILHPGAVAIRAIVAVVVAVSASRSAFFSGKTAPSITIASIYRWGLPLLLLLLLDL